MEALLPSEIARLVFGYLEDQKCDDAARSFLESSPHLHECRTAVLNGRRFSTRVNGNTLVDIFDKFSAAHSLVQERLNKITDREVRRCGDLLEQLRFLIGGSRSQRFVVNINVPSQANPQTCGGSPIITSSVRKRHHSGSDRTKRLHKLQLFEKQSEPVSSQLGCETVEATPLESLPGHTNLSVPRQHEHTATQDGDVYCTSTKNDFADCLPMDDLSSVTKQICNNPRLSQQGMDQDNSSNKSEKSSPTLVPTKEKADERHTDDEENKNLIPKGKTMATSTDELRTYSSIEVQTTPYVLSETESNELDDEPIENLSLLTKELLNRTELQERIAENINKAILPIEMPSKDESICESLGGELNTSIMAELNSAIKSIVAATETDPVFEHFLDEIIGPNVDTDTSPDEEPDVKNITEPSTDSRIDKEPPIATVVDMELEEETALISSKGPSSSGTTEVPLKQRLRSSSRQQNNKLEDEGDRPSSKDVEKAGSSLEDHNAAAILSIINANLVSDKQVTEKVSTVENDMAVKSGVDMQSNKLSQTVPTSSERQVADSTEVVKNDCVNNNNSEKSTVKTSTSIESNCKPKTNQHNIITEQEIMSIPTLIVCSQEEAKQCLNVDTSYSTGSALPGPENRFIPIAPKGSQVPEPVKPLFLRTVQVPVKVPTKIQPLITDKVDKSKVQPISPANVVRTNRKRNRKVTKKSKHLKSAVTPTNTVVDNKSPLITSKEEINQPIDLESITLYANDNSFGTMLEAEHMPIINLDDSMTLTGTGLSPYLKFHDTKNISHQSELPNCEKANNSITTEESYTSSKVGEPTVLPRTENILITRRTPKSLLKSRSKNNRLSMSTPRRRSSHVRALDFNTPIKLSNSEQKLSGNKGIKFSPKSSKRGRSVCRTSLFKSPPFSNSVITSQKGKSPATDQLYEVPIATRSPAPKLMGEWEKYTGVGMILGGTSPHPSTSSVFEYDELPCSPSKSLPCTVKKSWDADLRQALQEYHQEPTSPTSAVKKELSKVKSKSLSAEDKDGENCDQSKNVQVMEQEESRKVTKQDAVCLEEIKTGRDDITDGVHKEQNNDQHIMEVSKQVKCSLVNANVEMEVCDDVQVVKVHLQDENAPSGSTELNKTKISTETKDNNEPKTKPIVKKYVKLKTLETKIKYREKNLIESIGIPSIESIQKKHECRKVSPESKSQSVQMSQMVHLETPRKTDNSTGIPPTPRVLSPSNSTVTPFTKIAEELSKVSSFVNTPDFPHTPNIALTPKVVNENTIDAIKKGEYGTCSPYYQPSTEQPDILEKLITGSNNSKNDTAMSSSMKVDAGADISVTGSIANDFAMSMSSSKLEITQFEVIKENLPKEEADKEFKISTTSKNAGEILSKLENPEPDNAREATESEDVNRQSSYREDSHSASGNESSDSSSSGSSSSSSCSSSCSCSSIATTSTPFKSVTKCKTKSSMYKVVGDDCSSKNVPDITSDHILLNEISPIVARDICTTSENNSNHILMQTCPSLPKAETSPLKLLPLIKSQEEIESSMKETPAKDEALLSEANISETPSSSKSGIECLTNLNSKISALDSPGDEGNLRQSHLTNKISHTRLKPKVGDVQHLLPDVSVALKPSSLPGIISSTTQPSSNLSTLSSVTLDGKLSTHLEEKRLRLMAKLKTKPLTKVIPQKVKLKQVSLGVRTNHKDKQDVPRSRERKNSSSQATSHDPVTKVIQNPEKKDFHVKNSKVQTKQKSNNPSVDKEKVIQAKDALIKLPTKERKYDKSNTVQNVVKKSTDLNTEMNTAVEEKGNKEFSKGRKITKAKDQETIQKKEERRCVTEILDVRSENPKMEKTDSKLCLIEEPLKSTEITEDNKATSKIMDPMNSTKVTSNVTQKCDPIVNKISTRQNETEFKKSLPNRSKDEECVAENVIPTEKRHIVSMSKVDQIKRDLFSDEENNDQRTTRSRTRQLSDAQKADPGIAVPVSVSQTEEKACESVVKKPKEELANVLECLKLVPANKNELVEKVNSDPIFCINEYGEYEFIYDDSMPNKKKRKKFHNKDLQYLINVALHDEDYKECPRLMTPTDYIEIFNKFPKPKKRVVNKKLAGKNSKPSNTDVSKPTNATTSIVTKLKKDTANSSASTSSTAKLKNSISKVSKNTTKIQAKTVKSADKDDTKKPKDNTQVVKKRKMTESEEEQLIEKKRRIADPQKLLKKLDLDLFLTSVHGPV